MEPKENPFNRKPIEIAFDKARLAKSIGINGFFFIPSIGLNYYAGFNLPLLLLFSPILFLSGIKIWFSFNKWIEKKPAFIINSKGIWDNSNDLSIGWIEWGNIKDIKRNQLEANFITLVVEKPQNIMNNISNPFKKGMMWINWKFSKSPILFDSKLVEMGRDSLIHEMAIRFRQNKSASLDDFSEHLVDDNG